MNLYRTLIRVRRSLIRMDADELTYPAHIMLRYELEKKMLEGSLPVKDLPDAWNEQLEQRLEHPARRMTPKGACRISTGPWGISVTFPLTRWAR